MSVSTVPARATGSVIARFNSGTERPATTVGFTHKNLAFRMSDRILAITDKQGGIQDRVRGQVEVKISLTIMAQVGFKTLQIKLGSSGEINTTTTRSRNQLSTNWSAKDVAKVATHARLVESF